MSQGMFRPKHQNQFHVFISQRQSNVLISSQNKLHQINLSKQNVKPFLRPDIFTTNHPGCAWHRQP